MDKHLGKEYPAGEERKRFLSNNCDAVVTKGYSKRFTPEALSSMKDSLSTIAIEINDIEEKKKEANDKFKEQLKPLVKSKKEVLTKIKDKSEFVEEPCFKFIDQHEGVVTFYSEDGDLIDFRPCSPEEMQGTIFQIARTGTHD